VRDLWPRTHLVETVFLDVERRDNDGVDLLGPVRLDAHWQAYAGAGFDTQPFQIDGDRPNATRPAGKTWTG
jgi:hypothetical protein